MAEPLNDNDDTLIRYLDGELETQEKADLDRQLKNDAALQDRLLNLQLAIAAVQQYGTKEKVKTLHQEMIRELAPFKKGGKVVSIKTVIRYGMALAASVILIVAGTNLYKASVINSDRLYDEAFVDYDASVIRGQQNTSAVQTNYQDHNYTAVTSQAAAQNLTQKDSLLIALSYLKMNNASAALTWFNALSKESSVSDDADFYLSLTYLKNKKYSEAVKLMKSIQANPRHVYHGQFSQAYIEKVEKLASK